MAKNRLDPKNLTIDFKQLMTLPIQDRINFFRQGGQNYFESLTPTQLAQLFPKYYQQQLPDIGRAVSGGTRGAGGGGGAAAPSGGGGGTTGGSGGPRASVSPSASAPTGTLPPPAPAKTTQHAAFLAYLEQLTGKKSDEGTPQSQSFANAIKSDNQYSSTLAGQRANRGGGGLSESEKRHFYALAIAEMGTPDSLRKRGIDPAEAYAAFMETPYNRGMTEPNKKHINQNLRQDYYEPLRTHTSGYKNYTNASSRLGSDKELYSILDDAHNRVLRGSNYSNLATQNSSADVAANARRQQTVTSEKYGELLSRKDLQEYSRIHGAGTIKNTQRWVSETQRQMALEQEQQRQAGSSTTTISPNKQTQTGPRGVGSEQELISQSSGIRGYSYGGAIKGGGQCVKGSQGVLGALLGDKDKFSKQIGHEAAGSMTLSGGNQYLNKTGHFSAPIQMSGDYLKDKSQWRIGDTVVAQGGGRGLGHIQVWNGKSWVSDFKQQGILVNGYSGHTLYRLNNQALQRLNSDYVSNMDSTGATQSFLKTNNIEAGSAQTTGIGTEATPGASLNRDTSFTKPKSYDSLNPKLKEFIDSAPEAERRKIFKQLEHLENSKADINGAYQGFLEKSKNKPEEAAKNLVDAVKTTPAGQLVKYGVGIVNGQKIDERELIDRATNAKGNVSFDIPGLEHISFTAASGGASKGNGTYAQSLAQGTYKISPQGIGGTISGYYQRFGQTTQGAFGKVFNVHQPGTAAVAGYDPKAKYTRTEIQFHAFPIKSQLDKMKSNGCIVMPPDQYEQFVGAMEQAAKTVGSDNIALSVTKNKDGTFNYKIIHAQQAQQPITPEQAVQAQKNDGSIAPTQSRFFMSQTGYSDTELKKIAQSNPGSTIMIDPNWDQKQQDRMRKQMNRLGLREQTYYEGRGGPTGDKWDPEEYKRIDAQRNNYNKLHGTQFSMDQWRNEGKYLLYEQERIKAADNPNKDYEIDNIEKYSDFKTHMQWRKENNIKSRMMIKNMSESDIQQMKQDFPDWKDHVAGHSFHEAGSYGNASAIQKALGPDVKAFVQPDPKATHNYKTPPGGIPTGTPTSQPPAMVSPAPVTASQTSLNPPTPTAASTNSIPEAAPAGTLPKENKYGGQYEATAENMAVIDRRTGKEQITFNRGEELSLKDGDLKVTPETRTNPDNLKPTNQMGSQQQVEMPSNDNAEIMRPQTYSPITTTSHNNFTDRLHPASMPQNDGIMRAYAQSIGFHDTLGSNYGYGTAATIRNGYDTIVS